MTNLNKKKIPLHVAIIMDGNRRWAAKRGLPVFAGHKRVVDQVIEPLIERAGELGISYVTFWAWSTENWSRSKLEVSGVMKLFKWALGKKAMKMINKGAQLKVIGDISKFPEDIRNGIKEMTEKSKNNERITVTYGLNYGGRDEILRAVGRIIESGEIKSLCQEVVANNLDTAGMPDPDLIIRPGGTKRLSGFMLWQSEYSELYFTDVLMPDFNVSEFDKALEEYSKRERRFGGGSFKEYEKLG